jgi:hypothetical protein
MQFATHLQRLKLGLTFPPKLDKSEFGRQKSKIRELLVCRDLWAAEGIGTSLYLPRLPTTMKKNGLYQDGFL